MINGMECEWGQIELNLKKVSIGPENSFALG